MNELPIQETVVGNDPKGFSGFLQSQVILTESIQILSQVLMKIKASGKRARAKLTDLSDLKKVPVRVEVMFLFDV